MFIGIDPGLKVTGLVALGEDASLLNAWRITAPKSDSLFKRIDAIATEVLELACKPTIAVIEIPFMRFPGSAARQYMLFGVLMVRLGMQGTRVLPASAAQLKKFATGSGASQKDLIRLEVYKRWKFQHPSNDVVDAYALAQLARGIDKPDAYTRAQKAVVRKVAAQEY